MKSIKKFLKTGVIFSAMLLIVGMYIAPQKTKAAYDEWFGYGFEYDSQTMYTDEKDKETTSEVGMECTYSDDSDSYYIARVFGVDSNGEKFDYSHGYSFTFYEGTSHEMINWVVENGCGKATVRGIGYNIDTEWGTGFSGNWSPDV